MRMLFPIQLEKMVKVFLESERPEAYRLMKSAGELDEVAKMRAEAAYQSYLDQKGEISEDEVREMIQQRKTDPLASIRYMAMRESRIVESVIEQMLDFPSEETAEETI